MTLLSNKRRVMMLMAGWMCTSTFTGIQPVFAEDNQAESVPDTISGASKKNDKYSALEIIDEPLTRTETLLHTAVNIQIYHPNQEKVMDEAFEYMKNMEKQFSTNLEGSDVYKINRAAGKEAVKVKPETFEVIKRAKKIAEDSDGLFDVSIGALTNLWKIGDEAARIPEKSEITQAIKHIDYNKITLDEKNQTVKLEEQGMALELGGISKGYIGSGVTKIFKKHGITTAIINLGGNVVVMGTNPNHKEGWNVGVQDPDQVRGAVVGTQRVKDGAIITSGIYERYLEKDGKKYHHIMDPKTGYPLDNNISGVTVFAPTSFDGDSYSTALFMLGIENGLEFINRSEGFEVVYIDKDKGVHLSDGLKDSFELTNEEYHIVK